MAEISQRSPNPLVREYHGASQAPKPVCVCVCAHPDKDGSRESLQNIEITPKSDYHAVFQIKLCRMVMTQTYQECFFSLDVAMLHLTGVIDCVWMRI